MTQITRHRRHILFDVGWITFSVLVAIFLVRSGILETILFRTSEYFFLDSLIAGFFFTSVFTTAPAIVTLGEIAQNSSSLLGVALVGALGAMLGDMIIYSFMKNRLEEDIYYVLGSEGKKMRLIMRVKLFRWMTFFFGAIILASPVPDEVGLMMMGISKAKPSIFMPTSFIFNFLGILIIGLVARAL